MSFDSTWSTADPDAVGNIDNAEPPEPGVYDVTLIGAGAFTSKKQEDWVKLLWRRMPDGHEWPVLLGFASEKGANFTKRECRELGVNVDTVGSLDELDTAVKAYVGHYYTVEVVQNGEFRNTYLRGRMSDVPADTSDFAPAAVSGPVDDTIPF